MKQINNNKTLNKSLTNANNKSFPFVRVFTKKGIVDIHDIITANNGITFSNFNFELGGELVKPTTLIYNELKFIAGEHIGITGSEVLGFESVNSASGTDYPLFLGIMNDNPSNTVSRYPVMRFNTNSSVYKVITSGDEGAMLSEDNTNTNESQVIYIKEGEVVINKSDSNGDTTFELRINSDNELKIVGLVEYDDDADAALGGLTANKIYINSTSKALTVKQ